MTGPDTAPLDVGNGSRWRLPDGREGVQVALSGRQLRLRVIDADALGGMGPAVVAWIDRCTLLPSRYLRGVTPRHPLQSWPASSTATT